jgi:YD repeat-containing protein
MRVRVDHGADAVYLNLTDRPIQGSEELADGVVVDYDAEGRIVGIEILDASRRTGDPGVLKQFSFEIPTVGISPRR